MAVEAGATVGLDHGAGGGVEVSACGGGRPSVDGGSAGARRSSWVGSGPVELARVFVGPQVELYVFVLHCCSVEVGHRTIGERRKH